MESNHALYTIMKKLLVRLDRLVRELEPKIKREPITLDSHIDVLALSVRAHNCLINSGIKTVGALVGKSEDDLLKIKNIGRRAVSEIIESLKDNGLTKDISGI